MKKFPSTDYTFCDNKKCEKIDKCIRHLKHYGFSTKYINDFMICRVYFEKDEYKKCGLFWSNEE